MAMADMGSQGGGGTGGKSSRGPAGQRKTRTTKQRTLENARAKQRAEKEKLARKLGGNNKLKDIREAARADREQRRAAKSQPSGSGGGLGNKSASASANPIAGKGITGGGPAGRTQVQARRRPLPDSAPGRRARETGPGSPTRPGTGRGPGGQAGRRVGPGAVGPGRRVGPAGRGPLGRAGGRAGGGGGSRYGRRIGPTKPSA